MDGIIAGNIVGLIIGFAGSSPSLFKEFMRRIGKGSGGIRWMVK